MGNLINIRIFRNRYMGNTERCSEVSMFGLNIPWFFPAERTDTEKQIEQTAMEFLMKSYEEEFRQKREAEEEKRKEQRNWPEQKINGK